MHYKIYYFLFLWRGGGGGEKEVYFKKWERGMGKLKMGTEQRMVVAKGPGLKLGFLFLPSIFPSLF